ncbi:sushi domain-containing protein 5 [Syngnathoides biaculeatus]|uniref:sushi domain-containing protein 5 n=1 Tax=Syngnathoides biaculeatus TaxID=300417 RepID=UPI002ADDBE90|nr:sushi domain-containing protein 5 [Syngnathoides biaculeatus]XP_061682097.1 sushi domain-containing protein 5 [Syngnathoides biaculeatus]XP_061682102.1 sushi domain-containing protein 5 [Syngnathoides biaculeatus]XP_061682111.1 sushi domain-containing protein 5 [Syngnathoides biaculeatus]XP_061682120.1 sushi domain-containing protein 5 [Syngnathoides biaculeatus]
MLGFLGCLACLLAASVVNADGRVFVAEFGNSSSGSGSGDAERACASRRARLASASELRHAVVECFFSACTRGWLHGGTLGTTVCNYVGGSLKVVDVRTENATGDAASANGFCIKDKGVPCGDPPSFPNTRLRGRGGFEVGDELLYACAPGYVMANGHGAFSLLCDSCGEWYGLVQICLKDSTQTHVDYDDQFPDSKADHRTQDERPVEDHSRAYEEVRRTLPDLEEPRDRALQEISFQREEEDPDLDGQQEVEVDVGEAQERTGDENRNVDDFAGHPGWKQEATTASTDPPVSLLSQKHLFWFPSQAFQEQEQHSVSVDPVTQTTTQRSSGSQSDERVNQHEPENLIHRDDGQVEEQIPVQLDVLDERDRYEDHRDDHYDVGEQEEVHNGGRNDSSEGLGVHEDSSDLPDLPDVSEEHPDRDDHVHGEHSDHRDDHEHHHDSHHHDDHYDLVDQHNREDHDSEDHNHAIEDSSQDGGDTPAEHDSREADGHQRFIFSETGQNATRDEAGVATTTDETWLDGHPVAVHPNEVEELVPDSSVPATPEPDPRETGAPDNPPSSSSSDVLEYDTQQAVPTHSWLLDLTQHPFPDPAQDGDRLDGVTGERTLHNLPGETGERGEVEGEMGGTLCDGENCPPPGPSRRGPTVAAIIAAVCVVAAAVMATVWCYRRRQQKSSVYDINGKGQGNQHMEMQQKV